MKYNLVNLVTSLVALGGTAVWAEEAAADSDVLVLTTKNFKETIEKESTLLVEFYAPWCGHCRALAPEYEKAATELKDIVKLAKVDCTTENEVCKENDVQGFPTLKVFKNGKPKEFGGKREASSIISYMERQVKPAVTEVTADGFEEFKKSDKVVVVGFFGDATSEAYKTFSSVADELRDDMSFGASVDADLAKANDATAPAIILYRSFDEPMAMYKGDATDAAALSAFIKAERVPLIDDIGPENYGTYVESGLPLAFIFSKFDDTKAPLGKIFEPVAKEFKGKINFCFIDADQFGAHAENLALTKQEWPAFAINKIEAKLNYPFDQSKEITTEAISAFVAGVVDGSIEPTYKSEPIPETNDGPVKIVVHHEYNKIVMDETKDVLVEFYAPWCGHCKQLQPKWESLGELYASHADKIVIAKMDATANDFPAGSDQDIRGFPTIKLFKAGAEKEVVEFDGPRTVKAFADFLKENAVNKVEVEVPADADGEEADVPEEDGDFGDFEEGEIPDGDDEEERDEL